MNTIGFKQTLERVSNMLIDRHCKFAIAGGLAANFYRSEIRVTKDIDIMLYCDNPIEQIKEIFDQLGYKPSFAKLHDLKRSPMMNKKSQPILVAIGRGKDEEVGIDFLLPEIPWFENAIDRAQKNRLSFGFSDLPCITLEDLIISKVFAGRLKDYDDIISVSERNKNFDFQYVKSELQRLKLKIPNYVLKEQPKEIRIILKRLSASNV